MKLILHRLSWVLIFIVGSILSSNATHIVGGDVTYRCLGNNDYQIIIKVYKDCSPGVTGTLDTDFVLAIYRGSGVNFDLIDTKEVLLAGGSAGVENIPPPDSPCLILPDNICVEQGTYRTIVNLPTINESYHFVYQRCCRNNTISNLVRPDITGATFTTEITPDAQQVCNNAPVFNNFPPLVICVNEPINFDHSATDADGDQLVYELCSPLKGGGTGGGAFVDECEKVTPNPPCPPPHELVEFVLPTFTPLQPMGGDPTVTINPLTGIITGTPTMQGQFVVGVCVKEFRNGTLLSSIQRDFQFNVSGCTPLVNAAIDTPIQLSDETYVINSCGDSTVQILNSSLIEQDVLSFFWEFDIEGEKVRYNDWSPTVTLPDIGVYSGKLVINPGEVCGDSAKVVLNIYPPLEADFLYEYDTCVAGVVSFEDASFYEGEAVNSWQWDLGDGTTSNEQNPEILYQNPGNYSISLAATDTVNGCVDTIVQDISWFPVPPLIVIEPSSFSGCPPADIFFNNLTTPIDTSYQINWEFGDGSTTQAISPNHAYTETGVYSIDVTIVSPFGCETERTYPNWINITPEPIAGFTYSPQMISNFNSTVVFQDSSQFADSWFWDFNQESTAFIQEPTHTFRDTGLQEIQLIVTHPNGCADTIMQLIDVVPEVTYYLPNAFTPNGDGENDLFMGTGYLDGITDFNIEIWTRWGDLIFESDDPTEGWNGTKNNVGTLSPAGVYVVLVTYKKPRGQVVEERGYLTLLR